MTQRMTKGKSEVKSNYTTRPRATAYTTVYKKSYVANLIQMAGVRNTAGPVLSVT